MKNGILTLLLLLLFIPVFSQNFMDVSFKRFTPTIKKEKFGEARSLGDIIPDYQAQRMMNYGSVEILATCDGKAVVATGTSDMLTAEQKNTLNAADLGTDIVITFKYNYSRIDYLATVVPETEAEYPGGYQQMVQYLKENVINKIPQADPDQKIPRATVTFAVNEEGQIVDAKILEASTDPKTDKLLVEAINKMPKWSPAKNSKGTKVKQEFKFNGFHGGGC